MPQDTAKVMELGDNNVARVGRVAIQVVDNRSARKIGLYAAIFTAIAVFSVGVGIGLGFWVSEEKAARSQPEQLGEVIIDPRTGVIRGPGVTHTIHLITGDTDVAQPGSVTITINSDGDSVDLDLDVVLKIATPEDIGDANFVNIGTFGGENDLNGTYVTAIVPNNDGTNGTHRVQYTCGAESCVPGWGGYNSRRRLGDDDDDDDDDPNWACGKFCKDICEIPKDDDDDSPVYDDDGTLIWQCENVTKFVCKPFEEDDNNDDDDDDDRRRRLGKDDDDDKKKKDDDDDKKKKNDDDDKKKKDDDDDEVEVDGDFGSGEKNLTDYEKCELAVADVCGRDLDANEALSILEQSLLDNLGVAIDNVAYLPYDENLSKKKNKKLQKKAEKTCRNVCKDECCSAEVLLNEWVADTGLSSCFPAHAQVTVMRDGAQVASPISQVGVGDLVKTTDGFETIYFQGHASKDASPYVRLSLDSKHTLELSPDHYLRLVNLQCELETHVLAKDAAVGMRLAVSAEAEEACQTATVKQVERTVLAGAYNPYTTSGTIIVNGIAASCHSSWFLEGVTSAADTPLLYQQLLAPLRALYAVAPRLVKSFCAKFDGDNRPMSELGLRQIVGSIVTSISA